jgi:hypothetical protein
MKIQKQTLTKQLMQTSQFVYTLKINMIYTI